MSLESTALREMKRYGVSASLERKVKSYNADTGETSITYNKVQDVYLFEDTSKANKLRLDGLIENTDTFLIIYSTAPIEPEMVVRTVKYDYTLLAIMEHKEKEKDILFNAVAKRTKK